MVDYISQVVISGDSRWEKLKGKSKRELMAAAGLWKERTDLPDFNKIRKEFDALNKKHDKNFP